MSWHDWNWWVKTDAGLLARISIGVTIFVALAAWDLARNGRAARRWREYLFLLVAAVAGVAYGAANDAITSGISWEYFYYGKGLDEMLGPKVPPDMAALRWEAVKVGMKAAGSAGLVIGAALLFANNPSRRRPQPKQLPYGRLTGHLAIIMLLTGTTSALMGTAGYFGTLSWMSFEIKQLVLEHLFRPVQFQTAFGIHMGAYLGGILGVAVAVWRIRRERRLKQDLKPVARTVCSAVSDICP